MNNYFKLNNREEVVKFDIFLKNYYAKKSSFTWHGYLDLVKWFDLCIKNKNNGGRVFISILDIKINLIFLEIEMNTSITTWEINFNKKHLEEFRIIDDLNYLISSLD